MKQNFTVRHSAQDQSVSLDLAGDALPGFDRRQIHRGAQPSGASPIEHGILHVRQQIGAGCEFSNDLVERNGAAARNEAISFSLWALVELAEPTEVIVCRWLEQKNVDLMVGDTHPGARFVGRSQGAIAGPPDFAKAMLRIKPEGQIKIGTFMPNLDALTTEGCETGNLLP